MAFTVPAEEPVATTGLRAGDWIESSTLTSLVLRDRFVFATRRRLLASLPKIVTTAAASYQTVYRFQVKMLPTASGAMRVAVTASDDCSVRVIVPTGNLVVNTLGPGCIIGSLTGLAPATWIEITVQVQSNTGSPVTIYGINMQEAILDAADLP